MVFLEYLPGDSLFHRIDVRTKIIWLTMIMCLTFIFTDPLYLGIICAVVFVTAFLIRLPFERLKTMFLPLIPIMTCILAFSGFGFDVNQFRNEWARKILIELAGVPLSTGGVLMGVTFLLRLFIIVISTSIVTLTTPFEDFTILMRKMRFPYGLILAFLIAVRFIPTLMNEFDNVLSAQQARGLDLERGGFLQKIRKRIPLMIPMLVSGIRRAEELAIALLVRCLGASKNITTLRDIKYSKLDYMISALFIAMIFIGFYVRMAGLGVL